MQKPNATPNVTHSQQAKLDNGAVQNSGILINECWSIVSGGISELFPLFFSQLDDDLFKLSEKAETNANQTQLFDAMRYFRREREGMQSRFLENLSQNYRQYWEKQANPLLFKAVVEEEETEGLSLIDDELLEESLAVNGMIEKGNAIFHSELFPLNERFSFLYGKHRELNAIPVSPDALSRQFSLLIKPMEIDIKVKLLVYKWFDRQILSKFGNIYQSLNAHLADKGVLPSITPKSKKQKPGAYTDESGRPVQSAEGDISAELAGYLETFRTMQSLMDSWRLQLGMSSISSTALPGAAFAESAEVVNVMDEFQHSPSPADGDGQPISAEGLKLQVARQLGKLKGGNKTIGRPEEDIIDMVGIMFDYILDDSNISPAIKCLIARLQIPLIKVAILDKTFFAKKSHPSRILLNELAQAGIGLGMPDLNAENPIIEKIEEIVNKVLNEFSKDIGLFDELLKDFTSFMEKESKRSLVAESRTLQTTQSKEKVWLAKKAVATEITLRMQNVDAPLFFRTFIYNDWKDVLLLSYLRRDKDEGEWERSLETLDKMIWSITPPANGQDRLRLAREIPGIVKSIREGLETTSLDARQLESLLKELELCHIKVLHGSASSKSAEVSRANNTEAVLPTQDVEIKDVELAEAIQEIKSFLPDISNIDVEEVVLGGVGVEAVSEKAATGWLKDFVKDKYWEAANQLKVGDWVGFTNDDGQVWRAKLAWKSPATSLCVFVNRRGVKVLELKLNDLIVRMRQGRAAIIEGGSIPLMDRAMSFLTQSLQNPFAKPTEMPSFA